MRWDLPVAPSLLAREMTHPLPLLLPQHEQNGLFVREVVGVQSRCFDAAQFLIHRIVSAGVTREEFIAAVDPQRVIPQPQTHPLAIGGPLPIQIIVLHQSITRSIQRACS
ncbi:hypothetical protein IAD21_06450 (plasmid) [Abditibacteriota bacterium]|nr:hypothetical protein IAD21_06450 [Abditibacteriota bacterium]